MNRVSGTILFGLTLLILSACTGLAGEPEIVGSLNSESTSQETTPTQVDATPIANAAPVEETLGTLSGHIIQGTEGGPSVEDMEAVLHIYDTQFSEQVAEYIVGPDGAFEYEEVVIRSDYAYLMTVQKDDVRFSSQIMAGDPSNTNMVLDVIVYEATDDAAVVSMTSYATQVSLTEQGLNVIKVITMENNSDRMYVRDADDPSKGSVSFSVPTDATLEVFHTDPDRYVSSDDGLVTDTQPVLPGVTHYILFSYTVPMNETLTIEQPMTYTVDGPIAYYVETEHLALESSDFNKIDEQAFNGNIYDIYEVNTALETGQSLQLDVHVIAPFANGQAAAVENNHNRQILALVLVLFGILFTGTTIYFTWRERHPRPQKAIAENAPQAIMQQIAELDALFEAGNIDEAAYQKQRSALKIQLMQMMKNDSDIL